MTRQGLAFGPVAGAAMNPAADFMPRLEWNRFEKLSCYI